MTGLTRDGRHYRTRKHVIDNHGYPALILYPNGRRWHVKVHQLLLLTFIGPQPFPGAVGRHLDDNPMNYDLSNLAWGTRQDNADDAKRNGGTAKIAAWRAERTHCTKGHEYTPDNVFYKTIKGYRCRYCRTCQRDEQRARRAARKQP